MATQLEHVARPVRGGPSSSVPQSGGLWRDPGAERQHRQPRLLEEPCRHGRVVFTRRLAPDRGHRADRRGRVSLHHGPEEGFDRDLRGNQHRAAARRESAEERPPHQPGNGLWRPASVPGGAHLGRPRGAAPARPRARVAHDGRRPAHPASRADRAGPRQCRAEERVPRGIIRSASPEGWADTWTCCPSRARPGASASNGSCSRTSAARPSGRLGEGRGRHSGRSRRTVRH